MCYGGPALTARYGVYTKEGAALLVVVHFSKLGVWFNEGQRETGRSAWKWLRWLKGANFAAAMTSLFSAATWVPV